MAANTDLLKKLSRRWVGQIGAGGVSDDTTTTVPLASTTNLPTDTAVVAVIDRVDANGTATPSLEETIIGVVSGSNLANSVRGAEGTAQAHDAGAVVEILFTAQGWNDLVDQLLVEHNQLGGHTNITASNITASGTLTASGVVKLGAAQLTFPATDGTASQVIQTNASGVLSFVTLTSASVDGWISTSDSWTYASANTVTVPSGAASLYKKGDRVKFTQTTVKYFVITGVADTVLTFAVSTDYVVANAAISAISYSHQANPIGFPHWFAYTPTGVAGSNVTLTGRFNVLGNMCRVRLHAAFTGAITFTTQPTLPITASASIIGGTAGTNPSGVGGYLDNGTAQSDHGVVPCVSASGTVVNVGNFAGGLISASSPITWANGDTFTLDFNYEI